MVPVGATTLRSRLQALLLCALAHPALPFVAPPPTAQCRSARQLVPHCPSAAVDCLAWHAGGRGLRAASRASKLQLVAAIAVAVNPAPNNRYLRQLWAVRRSTFIWTKVLAQAIKAVRLRGKMLTGEALVLARRKNAAELRDTLIELGPTFIKIGQLLSTRVDVLEPEVIDELSRLQNEVPSFPGERALAIIKEELGSSASDLFASFDSEPLAAASLAQVHRAVLKSGEEVVVKVQREHLVDLFTVDLWNIKLVAKLADRFDQQTEGMAANWKDIADTSGKVLFREVDFNIERNACEEFGRNFANFPSIKIPSTFPQYSTSRVMTMEYVPGVKISDAPSMKAAGYDPVHISEQLCTSYLEQVCRHGFFHCDPHPGNLAVDDGHPGGRLIYYDFGMMERMEPEIKKGFVDLIFSIYENLPREACEALEQMGVLRAGADKQSIENIARNMLEKFESTLASADNKWENQMTPEEKKAARRKRRAEIGKDLFATQSDKPFLFPPKWSFVFRAFSTIDGIGKGLDPKQFDLSRISQPYLRELANLRDGSSTTTAIKEVGRRLGLRPVDIKQAVTQPRTVASLAESMRRLTEGDVKLRTRSLEVELTLARMEERQMMMGYGIGAVVLYQLTLLSGAAMPTWQRTPAIASAIKCAWEAWRAQSRMKKLREQAERFANEGKEEFDEIDVYSSMQDSPLNQGRGSPMSQGHEQQGGGGMKQAEGSVVSTPALKQGSPSTD